MKLLWKIVSGVGITVVSGAGLAAGGFGIKLALDKKHNAEIFDSGQVSKFTNHLFDTPGLQPLENNINILNLGDSVAHGDYTWQILDKVKEEDNEHHLDDGPPRFGSYYEFLVDALNKNGVLQDGYKVNYDTSVSGIRAFEVLNWISNNHYIPLTDHGPEHVRKVNKDGLEDHGHVVVNEDANKLVEKIKDSNVITLSIGGNDLIRAINLFGKPFNDSFDTSNWGDKFSEAIKSGNLSDIVSLDMDKLPDIYAEFESNLESILQVVHTINPNTRVMLFETAYPFVHMPKVAKNLLMPIYSKLKSIAKRVAKIHTIKNDGKLKSNNYGTDFSMNPHLIYDQERLDGWKDNYVDGATADPKHTVDKNGLNWVSFTSIDYTSAKNGDPDDVYKANSVDIHPTLEGHAKIAKALLKTMHEKFGLKDIVYSDDDIKNRILWTRELHSSKTRPTQEWYTNKIKEKANVYPWEQPIMSPDFAYDIPTGENALDQEKRDNLLYTYARGLFGMIDAFTDRIYMRRNLVLKDLDFKGRSTGGNKIDNLPSTFKEYENLTNGLGKFAQDKYYELGESGSGNAPIKKWKVEAIQWLNNHKDGLPADKLKALDVYNAATTLMNEDENWDLDGDHRYTLSDIQLGQISSIKFDEYKDTTGVGSKLDQVIDWDDFNNLWTRAFTDSLRGTNLFGLNDNQMQEQLQYSGSYAFDQVNGIHSTLDRLRVMFQKLEQDIEKYQSDITTFMNDHKDDFKTWAQDLLDFVKDLDFKANPNVVADFMTEVANNWDSVAALIDSLDKLVHIDGVAKTIEDLSGGKITETIVKIGFDNLSTIMHDIRNKVNGLSEDDRKELFTKPLITFVQKILDNISNGKLSSMAIELLADFKDILENIHADSSIQAINDIISLYN